MRLILLSCLAATLFAQGPNPYKMQGAEVLLWPNMAKGAEDVWMPKTDAFHRVQNVHNPAIYVYLPSKDQANGAAVIVCPGGGHRYLVMDNEGETVARKLNAMGVAAFVLKSRLQNSPGSTYKAEVESLADALQAIRIVRKRATEWGVDRKRVGIIGFSAGGHLAALAETRFTADSRPDFAVLGYPGFKPEEVRAVKDSPPTFLAVANDDKLAPVSVAFYMDLRKMEVPAELHIYNSAGHGFGMTGRDDSFRKLGASHWPEALESWMRERGILSR